MKVLIIFSGDLGGAERSLSRMVFASNSTIEYQFATIKAGGPWYVWVRSQGVDPLVFGRAGSHYAGCALLSIVRLLCYLRSNPVDIVYICGVRASTIFRCLGFLAPTTLHIHAVRSNPGSNSRFDCFFRLVERTTGFLVDAWITNSQVAKTTLIQRCGVAEDRIHVVYNGVNVPQKKLPNFNARPLEVLTIANLRPSKGHIEYLAVIQAVIRRVPGARFVFIGRDDMHGEFQRAIERTGLGEYVGYEGFQTDVAPWLRRARLFVLPSLFSEGCPTSILEVFSYAVPVVAYAIDGVPELVDNGSDGYLTEVGDEAFADRIVELLLDSAKAEAFGHRGRLKVSSRFVLDSCVSEHEKVFRQLIDK